MKLAFLDSPEELRKAYRNPRNARLWTAIWITVWLSLAASAVLIPWVSGPLAPIVAISFLAQLAGYYSLNLVRYWNFHRQGLIYTTTDAEEAARVKALYIQMWVSEPVSETVEDEDDLELAS